MLSDSNDHLQSSKNLSLAHYCEGKSNIYVSWKGLYRSMWCTCASQQLKLKRQLFISYHLFSAICPPLSGMLPGNIFPGFYITYVPITVNGLCEINHWSASGMISVLIWIWMKCLINKWPWSPSLNMNVCFSGANISLNLPPLLLVGINVFSLPLQFLFLAWFPPSAQFVTSSPK